MLEKKNEKELLISNKLVKIQSCKFICVFFAFISDKKYTNWKKLYNNSDYFHVKTLNGHIKVIRTCVTSKGK